MQDQVQDGHPTLSGGAASVGGGIAAGRNPAAEMPGQNPAVAPTGLPLVLNTQYVKAISFEVPGAPAFYTQKRSQPNVEVQVDTRAVQLQQNTPHFEVTLVIQAVATSSVVTASGEHEAPSPAFNFLVAYSGIFTLSDIPPAHLEPVLFVECPRLLFPFARNVLADATRDAGLTPVLLQPLDFTLLWQQRRAQQAAEPAAPPSAQTGGT